MKVFLFGNPDSFWFKYYLETVVLTRFSDVTIIIDSNKDCRFIDFYRENRIKIIRYNASNDLILKVPKVRSVYINNKRKQSINEKYDLVIIFSCRINDLKIANTIMTNKGCVYSIFTGSDIIRSSKFDRLKLNKILKKCNARVFATSDNPAMSLKRLSYVRKNGCIVIPFGLISLSLIDLYRNQNPNMFKEKNNIDLNKKIVCIGYNAREEQQHIKVIKCLEMIDDKEKNKIMLVVPMTYMREDNYCHRVESILKESGYSFMILDHFMNQEEMAQMWLACDIFINSQTTDAMSASVIECLHAGVDIISGSWLKYPELEKIGLTLEKFNDFEELPAKIISLLEVKKSNNSKLNQYGYDNSIETYKNKWHLYFDRK